MAGVAKFTDEAVSSMIRHNQRLVENPSNPDICSKDDPRSKLNYSIPLDHGGLTDYEYYKQLIDKSYLYGRGSAREKDAITACGWVVTLPKEITGDREKEKAFFQGVFDFCANRYGKENIISNSIHYDEGGQPHIHIIFSPITKLDHKQVQFKTQKQKIAVKLESGRYEYPYKFKLDENGEKIALKNYARMSDYYDTKIAAAEVLNKAELQHFHQDLQSYLTQNGIEGAVLNGATANGNMTVKSMKEFTRATGLTVDQIQEIKTEKTVLEEKVLSKDQTITRLVAAVQERDSKITTLQQEILQQHTSLEKVQTVASEKQQLQEQLRSQEERITKMETALSEKEHQLSFSAERNTALQERIQKLEQAYEAKQQELEAAQAKIEQLEKEKTVERSQTEKEQSWGTSNTSSWGRDTSTGWGKSTEFTEEKTW